MQSDEELIRAFKNPATKEDAFRSIITQFQERLYNHIRRMVISHYDTDDILQNVFIKAWKGLDNFRGDSALYSWLYRIATNETINFLNKEKKNLNQSLDESVMQVAGKDDGFGLTGDEIQLKLQRAILTLPDKQRLVFNLKYFEDKKYQEMSEILDTSVGALKASYHHAAKKIEEYLNSN